MADNTSPIAGLDALSRAELGERFQDLFGRPAPKRVSRDLLLRAVAFRVQEQIDGGLSKAALRRLAAIMEPKTNGARRTRPTAPRLKAGTRLVREWRGKIHQVAVREDGFDYRGTRYASLSHIAREITGTRWSGPVFFGLRKPGERNGMHVDGH